jgi:uncharacterized membrane protein YcaP (DUF421 family)
MQWVQAVIGSDTGDATAAQLCARALVIFAFGLICIRIAGRRTFAQATPLDIIVALIVGSNLSRAMTGKAPFLASLAATLLFVALHRVLAMAALRWAWLARWIKCDPVVLARDGVLDRHAMNWHGISDDDLQSSLRAEQVDGVDDVKVATLEGGGRITVLPRA